MRPVPFEKLTAKNRYHRSSSRGIPNMHPSVLLLLQLVLSSYALNELIRDYFLHKNVARVVGFSCDDTDQDFQTMRTLNDAHISASIKTPELIPNFATFMNVDVWKLGVFLDSHCSDENIKDIYRKGSEYRIFNDPYSWLVLTTNLSKSINLVNDSAFNIGTDFVICVRNNNSYDFYDVYNPCKYRGGSLNIRNCGTWQENLPINITLRGSKISRRWDLHGLKLKTAVIVRSKPKETPLLEYLEDESTKPIDSVARFSYSLVKHLPRMFNFTPDLTAFTHWEMNDTQGPLMRALQEGSIDFGCYPAKITEERLSIAKVSAEVWPFRTCFMFRTTPSTKIKISKIFRPLSASSWYTTALILLVIAFLFAVILKLETFDSSDQSYESDMVLIIVAALCQQGFPFESDQLASRIAFLQITIFGLLLYNYYSAAIVSAQLNEPLAKMNDSLYSLLQTNMKLAADHVLYFSVLTMDPNWEVQYFKHFWETKMPESQKYLELEEGVQQVVKGGFAYHADPNEAYPYINRYFDDTMICQLTEIHLFKPTELAVWTSLNGQFTEMAKIGMMRMISAGLKVRQIWHWTSRKPFCRNDHHTVESITIYDVAPIILLLVAGILLSGAIYIAEITIHHFKYSQSHHFTKSTAKISKSEH